VGSFDAMSEPAHPTCRTDGDLLANYLATRDETLFAELVRRHTPLVVGVCRRFLGQTSDAEDAAQAVFLMLAHHAASLRGRDSVAAWLHRVAWGVSRNAMRAAACRRAHEREAAAMAFRDEAERRRAWERVEPVLDGALAALPEKYRSPLILRYIEGVDDAAAARQVGCQPGAYAMRLARAREMLRARLARCGASVSGAMVAAFLSTEAVGAWPAEAAAATVRVGSTLAAGAFGTALPGISARTLEFMASAQKLFWLSRVKVAAAVAVTAAALAGGYLSLRVLTDSGTRSPAADAAGEMRLFPFRDGDRIAWLGAEATYRNEYTQAMEFLLATRHPDLRLAFRNCTRHEGKGTPTFESLVPRLDGFLSDFQPTIVFFSYGVNESRFYHRSGMPRFREQMIRCVERTQAAARHVILQTLMPADPRHISPENDALRRLYYQAMIETARERRWRIVDTYTPLVRLQAEARKEDLRFSISEEPREYPHMTREAYIARAFFLYERLNPPPMDSTLALSADGRVLDAVRCGVSKVRAEPGALTFTRADEAFPLLPPHELLPPRKHVPLEALSPYRLKIVGLSPGAYAIRCEGKPIGTAGADALAAGVNLNSLLLDARNPAPWDGFVRSIWGSAGKTPAGRSVRDVGRPRWSFEVRHE
jgi:RNA polymerase sigma factor (sigma-70 family)